MASDAAPALEARKVRQIKRDAGSGQNKQTVDLLFLVVQLDQHGEVLQLYSLSLPKPPVNLHFVISVFICNVDDGYLVRNPEK